MNKFHSRPIRRMAETIRTKYYAGECSRESAFQALVALVCEFSVLEAGELPELRRLRAAATVIAFMEPRI